MDRPLAQSPRDSGSGAEGTLTCPACGGVHRRVRLAAGERARCIRCGTQLAKGTRFGLDAALAWAVTGLILAVPATALPIVTVSKLANERAGLLFTGAHALWDDGMRLLAVWVVVCGALAPLLLLGTIVALALPARAGGALVAPRTLTMAARAFEHWAMPEVQVLAVLVALVKLHTIVQVRIGTGFWCYVAMSFMTLLAWRSLDLDATVAGGAPARRSP